MLALQVKSGTSRGEEWPGRVQDTSVCPPPPNLISHLDEH